MKSEKHNYQKHFTFYVLPFTVEGCELRVTGYELRVASCGLRVAGYELRVASCGLRVAGCGLRGRGGVGRSKGERVRSLEDGVADLWVPGKGGYKNWANTRLIFSKSLR